MGYEQYSIITSHADVAERNELVQELVTGGGEPPLKFLQNVVGGGLLPTVDVPKVDVSLLTSQCVSIAKAEAMKLHEAFSTFGCCLIVNHGMTKELLDNVRGISNDFFELSREEKSKYARTRDYWQGYGYDQLPKDYAVHDWTDRFMIKLSPENQRKMRFWPEDNPSNFREIMKECSTKVENLVEEVLKGMARSLQLEEKSFVDEIGEPRLIARFNLYPKCSRPDRVLGLNAHSDGSVMTFVVHDKEVEGSQLFKDGQWVRIAFPLDDDAILINLGDQGEILSNGAFKAPLHRVALNKEKARKSIAFFCLAEQDKVVGPVHGLVNETTSLPKYEKVTNYDRSYVKKSNHRALIESMKL